MAQFNLRDFKKQASFFLRERLNDARLALTDVSRIQLLAEEATNEDPWGPETKTMAVLADAAFELEEYERIVQVIHNRLDGGKQRPWRQLYKTLVVLEYLLTHGPSSIGKEFSGDIFCIEELSQFNFTDQQGIDRGSMVMKTADRVLELLNNHELWKEERIRARKLSVGIRGFGSNVNQAPHQDAAQGEQDSSVKDVSLSSTNLSQLIGRQDMCRMPNDQPPSMPLQAAQVSSANSKVEQTILARPFKKSVSSLGYLRERLPHLSRQSVAPENDTNDLEEVSTSLLGGVEESEVPFRPGMKGEATEMACRLVTC